MIMGYPVHELFLYFFLYSFFGWLMETCYCSIREKRLVPRGFLYGPICPIYGIGVLLMILFFTPLKANIFLFYITAVVVMTSWEYFVGWFLETTTHVKYWDYSDSRFNIKGRVCLWVALTWGALSYVMIFWVHPPIEALYERIPLPLIYTLCAALGTLLVVDTVLTVRHLALMSKLVVSVTRAGEELQVQMALGKAELSDWLDVNREKLDDHAQQLLDRYREQVMELEKHSRRFRNRFERIAVSSRYHVSRADIQAAGALAREAVQRKREQLKAGRKKTV